MPPNPVKLFENKNYCWTHGHDVEDDHTSATCNNPLPGHQYNAAKNNTMGGNPKKDHKYIMPSQAGKQGLTHNQPAPGQRNQRGTGAPGKPIRGGGWGRGGGWSGRGDRGGGRGGGRGWGQQQQQWPQQQQQWQQQQQPTWQQQQWRQNGWSNNNWGNNNFY